MKKISDMLVVKLLQRDIISIEKAEIYHTGIMLILADIINFSLVLLVGIITKSLFGSIIYLLAMYTVRRFSGGFHAKTYWRCRVITVGTYILIMLLSKSINGFYPAITVICNVFTILTMAAFAPIRHPNKKLTEKERKINKLFALTSAIFFAVISTILTFFGRKEGLIISLTLLAISILMYAGLLINGKEDKNGKSNG